jgi:AcrR family transcriptional regulator
MAWDTEQTRATLLAAAVAEFSAHGYAGARIERISANAGINRERLYSYFGNKRQLFEAVLAARLIATLEGVPVVGVGPEAIGDFAGRYFDACVAAPELARLVVWEGLEFEDAVDAPSRRARATRKVDELIGAVPTLTRERAEQVLLDIVTLCHGWQTTPNLGSVVSAEPDDRRRRAAIVRLAILLA